MDKKNIKDEVSRDTKIEKLREKGDVPAIIAATIASVLQAMIIDEIISVEQTEKLAKTKGFPAKVISYAESTLREDGITLEEYFTLKEEEEPDEKK